MIAKLSYVEKLGDADEFCQARSQHEGERTEFILYGLGCFPFAINCNGVRLFQTQQSRYKKSFVPVARPGKAKAREQCLVVLPSSMKAMPNKRAFPTDLTDIDNK